MRYTQFPEIVSNGLRVKDYTTANAVNLSSLARAVDSGKADGAHARPEGPSTWPSTGNRRGPYQASKTPGAYHPALREILHSFPTRCTAIMPSISRQRLLASPSVTSISLASSRLLETEPPFSLSALITGWLAIDTTLPENVGALARLRGLGGLFSGN